MDMSITLIVVIISQFVSISNIKSYTLKIYNFYVNFTSIKLEKNNQAISLNNLMIAQFLYFQIFPLNS